VTIDRGFDSWMDLFTTCTHDSELQVITVAVNVHISHITTAPLSHLPDCYNFTSCSLATASNNGDSSTSRAQGLSLQTPVTELIISWLLPLLTTQLYCCRGNLFTKPLPKKRSWYIRSSRCRCIATVLHARKERALRIWSKLTQVAQDMAADLLYRKNSTCWILKREIIVKQIVSVVYRREFLTTDPEVPGSIPGTTRFSEK
jgi:hypothetical protein